MRLVAAVVGVEDVERPGGVLQVILILHVRPHGRRPVILLQNKTSRD